MYGKNHATKSKTELYNLFQLTGTCVFQFENSVKNGEYELRQRIDDIPIRFEKSLGRIDTSCIFVMISPIYKMSCS